MYSRYFGLKEAPFRITPDPRYLYLSAQHREALAHLLYGIGPGGGFVQLTGEVGTGKTTVCRALLEQLPENVDIALILNPVITVVELLATICEELKIPVAEQATTSKPLLDQINAYLLDADGRGRRTILIIDEAQNLSVEVLEQVRLLTNLETGLHKLLQIFLIGQPELQEVLAQPNLRQLAQRITARFHLQPLNFAETKAFVQHRLAVAGTSRRLFSTAALRALYQWSGGIPRLLNVLCDRALLGAYSVGKMKVNRALMQQAATEVLGRKKAEATSPVGLLATAGGLLIVALVMWSRPHWEGNLPFAKFFSGNVAADATALHKVAAAPVEYPAWPRKFPLASADSPVSATLDFSAARQQEDALRVLASLWGLRYVATPGIDFCAWAQTKALRCLRATGTWNTVRSVNLPVRLSLEDKQGTPYFGVLARLEARHVHLYVGAALQHVSLQEVGQFWFGDYLLLWRPPFPKQRILKQGHRGPAVVWLRRQLALAAGLPAQKKSSDRFTVALRLQVSAFQRRHHLKEDGIVGAHTWLALTILSPEANDPTLVTIQHE